MEWAAHSNAAGGDETALIRAATANDLATLLRVRSRRGSHTDYAGGPFPALLSHHKRPHDQAGTAREGTMTAEPLPAPRTPDRPDVRRHIPVDPATLQRTLDGLRALRWAPGDVFTGRSVIDMEAWRARRDWEAAR
jgi:hypothetical protein